MTEALIMDRSVTICVDSEAAALERFAATQLQSYLVKLFDVRARITTASTEKADARFIVGLKGRPHVERSGGGVPNLSDQGHMLRRVADDTMVLAGGSPSAVCWAVYELVERYGVRYLVHDDVYPENAGPFHLAEVDVVLEPVQRTRVMALIRDNPIGSQFWSLDDHKAFISQLFKLKFNAARLGYAASCPVISYEVKGIRRVTGNMNYAQDMPIDDDNIGREHLGLARSVVTPEFEGAETFDEMHAILKHFLHGLIDHAKSLGIYVSMSAHTMEFPTEFRPLLQDPTTTSIQLGDLTCSEQGDLMNPDHVALVSAVFEAHLAEYGDLDELGFGLPEFAYAQSDFRDCWKRLRRRFGLGDVDIEGLLSVTRESGLTAGGAQRAEREFKSFVGSLDFYDRFFAQTGVLERMADKGIRPTMGLNMNSSHQALAFVHRALPENTRFQVCDYAASRLVCKLRWLEKMDPTGLDPIVMTTVQDDNMGWLPQVSTENLHILLQATHRLGWDGFSLQHWAIGDIDPPMAYLARASWDAGATPGAVYRDHFGHLYGERAVEPLCQVMRVLEDATTILSIPLGYFFPVLGVMSRHVRAETPLNDAALHVGAMYEEVRRMLEEVGEDGVLSHAGSRLAYWSSRMTFSIEAFHEVDLLGRGGIALGEAASARARGDEDDCQKHLSQARDYHDRAIRAGEAAVTVAASNVQDPSDRGGIAAYYHLLVREVNRFVREYVAEIFPSG